MRIVELDLIFPGELRPIISMVLFIATDNVLKRGGTEEVLLLQAELLTAWGRVIRVKNIGDILSRLALSNGTEVVA